MAHKSTKTEMKGTGGGRWLTRAEAKTGSDKERRRVDQAAIDEQWEFIQAVNGIPKNRPGSV